MILLILLIIKIILLITLILVKSQSKNNPRRRRKPIENATKRREKLDEQKLTCLTFLMIASILVHFGWSTTLFIFFFDAWCSCDDVFIYWPMFSLPFIVAHQIIEVSLLRCRFTYHEIAGRAFHATWVLHNTAALITTSMSLAGVTGDFDFSDDLGFLVYICLTFNILTLFLNTPIFYHYQFLTLPKTSDEEAPCQPESIVSKA